MFNSFQWLFISLWFIIFVSCGGGGSTTQIVDNSEVQSSESSRVNVVRTYGLIGSYSIAKPWEEPYNHMSVLYYPSDISRAEPTPVIFFAPGWSSVNHLEYESLLKFIASHGYTVIYAKDNKGAYSAKHLISHFREMVTHPQVAPYIDLSKIGVIGHSSGGGHIFKILDEFSKVEGWGSTGRFLFSMDPWFAFDMNKADMKTLPSNTNVLLMQFGKGGDSLSNGTDARIPLSEYYLLSSIEKAQKNYQIFEDANHSYPTGDRSYEDMQGILKPLDALMEYTFKEQKDLKAYTISLGMGTDDPYLNGNGVQVVRGIEQYHYRCDGNDNSGAKDTLINSDIDYCSMQRD